MKRPTFPDTLPDSVSFDPLAPPPRIPLPKPKPVAARAIAAASAPPIGGLLEPTYRELPQLPPVLSLSKGRVTARFHG